MSTATAKKNEIRDLKQKFNVDTTKLKDLQNEDTYKKKSVQNNISLDTQHYELDLSKEPNAIQEQLNFCQDVQLEYIKKHEELKTVFALALNLFQFYTYTLEIIDNLLKIQTPKQEPGYFTERNVILTKKKKNIEIPLISNYQPTKDADGNITDTISVEEVATTTGFSKDRQLGDDPDTTVFTAYGLTINGTNIKNNSENNSENKFKKDNLKITDATINDNFKLTIVKNSDAKILTVSDNNKNLELRLEITIKDKNGEPILNKIFVNIYFIPDLDKIPLASSAPPPIIVSTPPPAVTPLAETGGKVYFNRIKNTTFEALKDHQKTLREKLKGLNDLIVNTTTTDLKLNEQKRDIPLLNNPASSGGAIKSIVKSKSSKQKKSKKGPFEISKVINQLIGGNPIESKFYYTGEIVELKGKNPKYHFLELFSKEDDNLNIIDSTLQIDNNSFKKYGYKLYPINLNDNKITNLNAEQFKGNEINNIFLNKIQKVDGGIKNNTVFNNFFKNLNLNTESYTELELCKEAFVIAKPPRT